MNGVVQSLDLGRYADLNKSCSTIKSTARYHVTAKRIFMPGVAYFSGHSGHVCVVGPLPLSESVQVPLRDAQLPGQSLKLRGGIGQHLGSGGQRALTHKDADEPTDLMGESRRKQSDRLRPPRTHLQVEKWEGTDLQRDADEGHAWVVAVDQVLIQRPDLKRQGGLFSHLLKPAMLVLKKMHLSTHDPDPARVRQEGVGELVASAVDQGVHVGQRGTVGQIERPVEGSQK